MSTSFCPIFFSVGLANFLHQLFWKKIVGLKKKTNILLVQTFFTQFVSIEKFYLIIKENKKNFTKNICEIVNSEFVKTYYDHAKACKT